MRIGVFTDTYVPDTNGVVTVIRMMEHYLRAAGHEVIIFAPSHPDYTEDSPWVYRFPSIPAIVYPHLRSAIVANPRAFRLIRTLDIIHTQDPFAIGMLGFFAARLIGIPHLHTYHVLYADYRRYLPRPIRPSQRMVERLSRAFCNRCDAVIAPSTPIKEELIRYGVVVPIYVLPYGVDTAEFEREPLHNVREELGIGDSALILHVGRLAMEKNIEFVLRAFEILRRHRHDAKLVVVGDGPRAQDLRVLAKALGISSHVIFTGYIPREKLIDLYLQADLFVTASKTETQGLVVVEAMAAGLPVVALRAMGVVDLVIHGETGFLVQENTDEFAQSCLLLLEDRSLRAYMSKKAKERAQYISAPNSTKKLLEIYEEVRGSCAT